MSGKEGKKQIAICKKSGPNKADNCEFHDFDSKEITDFRTDKYNLTCSTGGGEDSALADAREVLDPTVGEGRKAQQERTDAAQQASQDRLKARKKAKADEGNNPQSDDDDQRRDGKEDARENPEAARKKEMPENMKTALENLRAISDDADIKSKLQTLEAMPEDDEEILKLGIQPSVKDYIDFVKSGDNGLKFTTKINDFDGYTSLTDNDKAMIEAGKPKSGGRRRRRGGTKRRRKSKRRKSKRRKKTRKSKRRKSRKKRSKRRRTRRRR